MLPNFDKGKVDQRVGDLLNLIRGISFLDGTLLEAVSLTTAVELVQHGLGRKPLGYLVLSQNASASIYEADKQLRTNSTFSIQASATVTADIWVF